MRSGTRPGGQKAPRVGEGEAGGWGRAEACLFRHPVRNLTRNFCAVSSSSGVSSRHERVHVEARALSVFDGGEFEKIICLRFVSTLFCACRRFSRCRIRRFAVFPIRLTAGGCCRLLSPHADTLKGRGVCRIFRTSLRAAAMPGGIRIRHCQWVLVGVIHRWRCLLQASVTSSAFVAGHGQARMMPFYDRRSWAEMPRLQSCGHKVAEGDGKSKAGWDFFSSLQC